MRNLVESSEDFELLVRHFYAEAGLPCWYEREDQQKPAAGPQARSFAAVAGAVLGKGASLAHP